MDDELGVALVVAHLKLTAQVEGGRVAEHLFKILCLSFFLPLETWLTLPKVLVWSLTVILCRQLGMGRQLEARGLDISRTIGVSSSSVRVRVKGRLEEHFETEVIIKEVVVYLEEQSQSQHQQLQSQRPRQGFLVHLVVEVINKNFS